MKFSELNLHPTLQNAIEKLNFTECTPVQELAIPQIIVGKDLAGLAQTGTGKTAAFVLPLMDRILRSQEFAQALAQNPGAEPDPQFKDRIFPDWHNRHYVLILVPTRELAEKVYENCISLKGESSLTAVSIYGGVAYDKQKNALKNGVEFIVATPGRFIDLYKEHLVDLKGVRAVVFDEADRMFDMGFKDDMKFILGRIPKERQFLVFSATLNLDVLNTAYQFGANPVEINVSRDQAKAENVIDKIFHIGQDEKPAYLLSLLKKHKPKQAIIFSNFKMNVPRVTQFLNDNGISTVGISSLLSQAQRNKVITQFKSENDTNILVATDVAARGLDIKGVDMVINFELPDDPENYVHRIGRTGRAGASGLAFSFISDRDVEALTRLEEYLRHKVDAAWLETTEIEKDFKPLPNERHDRPRSGGSSGGPRDSRRGGGDRGPRPQSGGPRDHRGGSGGDRGRGPRPGGDRPAGAGGGGGGNSGRPQERNFNRGPNPNGPANGPRPEGDRNRDNRGPRARFSRDNQGRDSRDGGRDGGHGGGPRDNRSAGAGGGNGRGGPRPQNGRPHQPRPGGGSQARPHSGTGGAGKHPRGQTPPKSVGQKITGFFKRLLGGQ